MRSINRQDIITYIVESCQKHYKACFDLERKFEISNIISMSFRYQPSITYLDLSTSEFTTKRKAVQTWLDWRKLIDGRLEIIYRLDLEDKNQINKCSRESKYVSDFDEITLDYHGFPGYYLFYRVNEPSEDNGFTFPALDEVIKEHIGNSSEKEEIIRKILPTILRFKGLFSNYEFQSLFVFTFETLFENTTIDVILMHIFLKLSLSCGDAMMLWNTLGLPLLKCMLQEKCLKTLIINNWRKQREMALELLLQGDFLKIEICINHGLHPLNENIGVVEYNGLRLLCRKLREIILRCFPEELENRVIRTVNPPTDIEVLVFMVLAVFKNQDGLPTLKKIWRCISNVYLTFDDFQKTFKNFPDTILKELENIYLWYQEGVNANSKCPRLLQHYCRCVLRKQLADNLNLPNGINRLCLPTDVKKYLWLER